MPNWCNNTIKITGPKQEIERVWQYANDGPDASGNLSGDRGLLDCMSPMPEELVDTTSPDDTPNWYDWRVENWGTKWEVSPEGLEFEDHSDGTASITGWFDSAWAPPIQAYDTYLEIHPECSISAAYEESGMDYAGIYRDGRDDYMEGITEWSESVVRGTCSLEDTPELFQTIDDELDLVESRRDWFLEEMAQ